MPDAKPLSHAIELRLTGHPDVKNRYGSGHLRPTEVDLRYRDDSIRANLSGRWIRDDGTVTDAALSQNYAAYKGDTSDWPDWLADLAKTHTPTPATPAGHTTLVEQGAAAIWAQHSDAEPCLTGLIPVNPRSAAAAVLAVLPPAAARAAVLLEAADELDRYVGKQSSDAAPEVEGARLVIRELRRIASQPAPVEPGKCGDYSPSGAYRCTQPAGHLGYHRRTRPDSDEWSSWIGELPETVESAVAEQQHSDRTIAYRSPGGHYLYCTRHTGELGDSWTPVTSDDLPEGGLCSKCGADVLIPWEGR